MTRFAMIALCVLLAGSGVATETLGFRPAATPQVQEVQASAPELRAGAGPVLPPVGVTFAVDIGGARRRLRELDPDEQQEQVADWAVLGTLLKAGASRGAATPALHVRVPFRDPASKEAASFEHGPGRRVILGEETWLFHPQFDPHPEVIVGRLADQVRMERGTVPAKVQVFTYRSDLAGGQIYVTLAKELSGAALFQLESGYFEQDVSSVKELGEWLASVDDVTFVAFLDGGKVRLGGRRFGNARTPGVALEDVAALYIAHQKIAESKRTAPDLERVAGKFNLAAQEANSGNREAAETQLAGVERDLSRIDRRPAPDGDKENDLSLRFQMTRSRIEHVMSHWDSYRKNLPATGKLMADEPGFSLALEWDPSRLRRDLESLRDQPSALIAEADHIAGRMKQDPSGDGVPRAEGRAADRLSRLVHWSRLVANDAAWRPRLSNQQQSLVDRSIDLLKDGDVEGAGLIVSRAAHATPGAGQQVDPENLFSALNDFVAARAQLQCARYDGPLQGTHVAMVLFYTDLLAKVRASTERREPITTGETAGAPNETSRWLETKITFGPRLDAITRSANEQELYFGHIGVRAYVEGPDPAGPTGGSPPAETGKRPLAWWDRKHRALADDEPQFHVQNQIVKWSVISGMLASRGQLTGLARWPIDRSARFDRWLSSRPDLHHWQEARLLPRSRWISSTECIEKLVAGGFPVEGETWSISGGVSLGSGTGPARARPSVQPRGWFRSTFRPAYRAPRSTYHPTPSYHPPSNTYHPDSIYHPSNTYHPDNIYRLRPGFFPESTRRLGLPGSTFPDGTFRPGLGYPTGTLPSWFGQPPQLEKASRIHVSPMAAIHVPPVRGPPSTSQIPFSGPVPGRAHPPFDRASSGLTNLGTPGAAEPPVTFRSGATLHPIGLERVHLRMTEKGIAVVAPELEGLGAQPKPRSAISATGMPPVEHAVEAIGTGKTEEAVAALATSAEEPGFQQSVQHAARADLKRTLAEGRPSAAARIFLANRGSDPEVLLSHTLGLLESRDLSRAADAANTLLAAKSPELNPFLEALWKRGGDEAELAIGLEASLSEQPLAASAIDGVKLQTAGNTLHSVATLKRPPVTAPVEGARRLAAAKEIAGGKAVVYVEDDALLTQKDWDFAMPRSLSEVTEDPRVIWEVIDGKELAGLAPAELKDRKQRYLRQSTSTPVRRNTVTYRLSRSRCPKLQPGQKGEPPRCCDLDGDGQMSQQELRRCG